MRTLGTWPRPLSRLKPQKRILRDSGLVYTATGVMLAGPPFPKSKLKNAERVRLPHSSFITMNIFLTEKPKVAIFVSGGVVNGVRTNIASNVEVVLVDADDLNWDEANKQWDDAEKECPFPIY